MNTPPDSSEYGMCYFASTFGALCPGFSCCAATFEMLISLLFCFIAGLHSSHGKYVPICQQASGWDSSGPELPTFPAAFSTSVEVNIVNKNYTSIYEEFYDQEANKGSLQKTKDGKTVRSIYDYNLNERIDVDLNAKNCTVSSINGSRRFNFFGNNNSHIESVSDLFHFAKKFNESYMGVVSVRGIKCNHWRACINIVSTRVNRSYYLDYYFAVSGWTTSWPSAILVRAVINGTKAAVAHVPYHFYHVYDFFNFRPARPDSSEFQLPSGYYCTGLKGLNKTVPIVPPVFSMESEAVWMGARSRNKTLHVVLNFQEIYDLEKKISLLKHPNWYSHIGGQVVVIHDFNTGISYNISTGKSGPVCNISALSSSARRFNRWDVAVDGHHHIRMKSTHELFSTPKRNGSSLLVFKGSTNVRGIDADIWVGKTMFKNRTTNESHEVILEWYFSKQKWQVMSGSQVNQHQVPLQNNMYDRQKRRVVVNYFNFDAEAAGTTAFDIKPCFKWEEQRFIEFSLKGDYANYAGSREFLLSIATTISKTANVSIIRVNGMRLLNNGGEMTVVFILLNKTKPVADVEVTVYPENGLMAALDALKNSVQSGKFKVEFKKETISAEKSSFRVGLRPTTLPGPTGHLTDKPSSKPGPGGSSKVKSRGVSSGAAAGISILMLVVGIFGGLLVAHVIMKRRGTSLFQYQRQE